MSEQDSDEIVRDMQREAMSTPQDAAQPANEVRTYRTCQRCHVVHWHESACPQCGKKNENPAQPDDATKLDVPAISRDRLLCEKHYVWGCGDCLPVRANVPAPKRSGKIKVRLHDKGPAKPTPCMDEPDLDDVPALNPADALEGLIRDTHGPLTAKDRALVDEVRADCDTTAPAPLSDEEVCPDWEAAFAEGREAWSSKSWRRISRSLKAHGFEVPDDVVLDAIGGLADAHDHWKQRAEEAEAAAREADKKYHERREALIERFDENNALEEKVADLENQLADIRNRLGGLPDSKLDGDDGLAAAQFESLAQLREENERLKNCGELVCPDEPGDPCEVCGADKETGTCGAGNPLAMSFGQETITLRARVAQLEEALEDERRISLALSSRMTAIEAAAMAVVQLKYSDQLRSIAIERLESALTAQEKESQ